MTAFLALVSKDLKIFFGDRRAVIMAFVAPILIGSFFGYVFGPKPAKEQGKVRVLFVDQDSSPATNDLFANLGKDQALEVTPSALEYASDAVRKGGAPIAIVVPKGFGEQAAQSLFRASAKPVLTLLFDPSHQTEASMVRGILTGQVMQSISKIAFNSPDTAAKALQTMDRADVDPAVKRFLRSVEEFNGRPRARGSDDAGITVPFETKETALTSRAGVAYNAYAHSFGGMAIQFMLFMGIDVGIGLLLLRERGLWRRFRAAPLSKATLLGSRAVSATLAGMLILAAVFGFAYLVFNVRVEGSFAGFVGVCAAFSLMTATYGLLIAALGKTPEAARGLAILGTLVMVMLSGAWVPSFMFPQWVQAVTKVVPARWAMDGIDAMTWRGLGIEDAIAPVAVLLFSSALFAAVAVWRFRWDEE